MITKEMLRTLCPTSNETIIDGVAKHFNQYSAKYEVNTPLRVVHFIAQAAHETDKFKTLQEYASGSAYEGREDLGNLKTGDGRRYKGRGIFQLTGRANYRNIGKILELDLENNPNLALNPEYSVLIALEYWKSRRINFNADIDDVVGVTKKINGGRNGLQDRINLLKKCKELYDVLQIQLKLIGLGYTIIPDGVNGNNTISAVRDFQSKRGLVVDGVVGMKTKKVLFSA